MFIPFEWPFFPWLSDQLLLWSETSYLSELVPKTLCSELLGCPVLSPFHPASSKSCEQNEVTTCHFHIAGVLWNRMDSGTADQQCFTSRKEVDATRRRYKLIQKADIGSLWTPALCFRIELLWDFSHTHISQSLASPYLQACNKNPVVFSFSY